MSDSIPFEDIVEEIDCIFKDGIAYMSIHTIDKMNLTVAEVVEEMHQRGIVDWSDETSNAVIWIMSVWQSLHDALDLEAAKQDMPNNVEELLAKRPEN